jgi:hypothetical protein
MRLHYSQGYGVRFNLRVVDIGECSDSEKEQKIENRSVKALL